MMPPLRANFVRCGRWLQHTAARAWLVGESSALHRGRTTMVWQTSIRGAEGKLLSVVTQTQLVLEGNP